MVKRNTFIYYTSQLFHSLIFTIPIWIVYYQARITPAQISILVTVQYIAQIVLELPSGALADLIGRRNTLVLGFAAGALSYLLFPYAVGFVHFFILALLVGASDSFRSGAEEALVYDTFIEKDRQQRFDKVYANGNMIYQVGLIASAALGGFIYERNHGLPFTLYGLSLLIGTILVWFYLEPYIDSEKFTFHNYLKQIRVGSREAFKSLYSTYLSLFYILVGGIGWSSTLYFNAYMMVDLGFSDSLRGLLTASMRLINVVLIASVLKNDRLFNWQRRILFFPLIMLFGYLPGRWLNGFIGLPFVQAAMIATTARWILLAPLTNETFSSKYRATAISLLSLLIGVVYIAMTGISGLIIPALGVKSMYTFMGVIVLLSLVPVTVKLIKLKTAQATIS
jgi:MFS family permease